jgi:hypothetical protein
VEAPAVAEQALASSGQRSTGGFLAANPNHQLAGKKPVRTSPHKAAQPLQPRATGLIDTVIYIIIY